MNVLKRGWWGDVMRFVLSVLSVLCFELGPAHALQDRAGVAWEKSERPAQLEALFAQARQQGKPLFLYWGAKWCPPCNQVKATVFTRPDFIAMSRRMIAVQLDGDSPGAQRLAEKFKVRGYPNMIVFNGQGDELMRLPGEVDATQYLQALQTSLLGTRPMTQVLAAARRGERLGAEEWRRLAWYSWEADTQELIPADDLAATLRQLARTCASQDKTLQNYTSTMRLQIKAVLEAADGGDARALGAALDPELRFDAGAAVLHLLGDGVSARQHTDIVTSYAVRLVEALSSAGTPQRKQLLGAWNASAMRLQADTQVSRVDRLGAMAARVELAGLEFEGKIPAGLQDEARSLVQMMDRDTTDPDERLAMIATGADLLERAGLTKDANTLLEGNLERSHSPYYLMSRLAANARKHGDKRAALAWSAKAWAASRGPATRIQWGSNYLGMLIELAPEDADRIEEVATRMLGELSATPDAYYQRNVRYVQRLASQLMQWGAEGAEQARLDRIARQWQPACLQLPEKDPRRAACEGVFKSRHQG